jgi:hypothetical protein
VKPSAHKNKGTMVDDQTWKACMSSEVFREYLSEELAKEAKVQANAKESAFCEIERQVDDEYQTWQQLEQFQTRLAETGTEREDGRAIHSWAWIAGLGRGLR